MYPDAVMSRGRILAGIAAFAVLICFFLPWITYGPLGVSGFDIAQLASLDAGLLLLYITPLAAAGIAVTVLATLSQVGVQSKRASFGVVVLAALALIPLVMLLMRMETIQRYLGATATAGVGWGIGFWSTVVACSIAFVGGLLDATAAEPVHPPPPPPVTPMPGPGSLPEPVFEPRQDATRLATPATRVAAWLVGKTPVMLDGRQWQLLESTTIGRDPASEVVLDEPTVSRRHAVIKKQGRAFYIYDLASLGGVYVNGRRAQRHLLYDKDVITLGNVTLAFLEAQ